MDHLLIVLSYDWVSPVYQCKKKSDTFGISESTFYRG